MIVLFCKVQDIHAEMHSVDGLQPASLHPRNTPFFLSYVPHCKCVTKAYPYVNNKEHSYGASKTNQSLCFSWVWHLSQLSQFSTVLRQPEQYFNTWTSSNSTATKHNNCTREHARKTNEIEISNVKLPVTRGQSNLTKCTSWGAHSPVRGHPRGSKFVPLNSWGRGSY